jgi:hypothetical protein
MPNTLTKEIRHTAVWGGALARLTGFAGKWMAIPTGHQTVNASFGTGTHPATSYTITSTADDLGSVIWSPLSTIMVRKCRIYYGEGGSTNTTHKVNLSRFDIDAEGDLSNGYVVGSTATDSGSDDYTTLAYTDLSIVAHTVTSTQVLIAFIMCVDNVNATFTAKCIIEYTM